MIFLNRIQAGEKLAQKIQWLPLAGPLILAIPRGGVPVGMAVARALACPLDVISFVRIPIPWNPEASYGAIAMDGTSALNLPLIHHLEISSRTRNGLGPGQGRGPTAGENIPERTALPTPPGENRRTRG